MKLLLSQRMLLHIAVLVTVGSWRQIYGQSVMFSGSGDIGNVGLPFLKFGDNQKFLPTDEPDSTSEAISIPLGFPFGTTIQSLAYVGDNGVLSFGNPFSLWVPQPFPGIDPGVRLAHVIAPYWSDNDIRREGNVSYEVFEFQNTGTYGDEVLTIVNNYIMEEYGNSTNFVGVYMILAEWNAVHPWPHGNAASVSSSVASFVDQTNTYQAVLITNLEESYAIFTYECDELQWSGLDVFPTIGFNSPSDRTYANHPLTAQEGATEIACSPTIHTNNVIYKISEGQSAVEEQKRMCLAWYISDFDNYDANLIAAYDLFTSPCPCSIFQAAFDRRFRFVFSHSKTSLCFTTIFLTFGAALRECCYSFDGFTFGALVTDTENGGSLVLSPIPDESLQQNNRIPQSLCCSAEVGLCNLYYERRLPNSCFGYRPPRFVWGFGDPHITTLDGLTYTFNGIGEYVLVRSVDDDIEFQGRTEEVGNSGATAFSAFAISHNGTTVQISWNGGFTVLVNGNNESDGVMTVNSTIQNSTYLLERIADNSLLLSFPSGLSLTTNYTSEIFNFVLNLPPLLNGITEGLLGTLNGNVSDDLIFRNGTLLPNTSSDAEKHSFGQSWQINQSESIFWYMAGQDVITFSQPNHMPPFLDEIRANLTGNDTLTAVCGDNTECLFDFSQTNDETVGMATMQFEEDVAEEVTMSRSFPPNISAPLVFVATVGIASTYSFSVTGSVNITVVINGQNTVPPNTNFTENGDAFTLIWTPVDTSEEFNLTIIATAEQSARSMFIPRVQLCGCSNGGNCTEDGVLNLESPFVVLNCECPAAYDGNICENDANGCNAISCLAGQSCTDNRAPMAGAMCACPEGYSEINSKCVDINECDDDTTNDCTELQVCINAPGSFSCSCRPGYRSASTSSMLCEDINECEEYNDCHQICINTDGSFNCSCMDGFELLPDSRTCNVTQDAMCQASNNCTQICYININNNATQICTCERGYQIDSDGRTCNDVNECNMTDTCSQRCNNTIGGFVCSCEKGYTLDSDGRTCNDFNECLRIPTPCMEGLLCNNTVGGSECLCPPGTTLIEEECSVIVISSMLPTATSVMPTATPTGTGAEQDSDDDGLSGGEIAGIVIGSMFAAIILLVIIVIIVIWATRYRAKSITITPRLIMYKNSHDDTPDRVEATPNVYSVVLTQTNEYVEENENREEEEETKMDEETTTTKI